MSLTALQNRRILSHQSGPVKHFRNVFFKTLRTRLRASTQVLLYPITGILTTYAGDISQD